MSALDSQKPPINKGYRNYFALICVFFFLLVGAGIHTSSVGILGGENIHGFTNYFGKPQPIRSDEYLRSTPIQIGQIKQAESSTHESKKTITTPFDSSYSDTSLRGDAKNSNINTFNLRDLYSTVLNLDDRAISLLPLQQEFVARWWLNTLYLFIGLGLIFRLLGKNWKYALLSSLLIWLSPPNQWWSLWPVQSLAPAAMASGLFLFGIDKVEQFSIQSKNRKWVHRLQVIVGLALSAVFAIRLPGVYQPWSVPTALFFTCFTVGMLVSGRFSKSTLKTVLVPFAGLSLVAAVPILIRLSRSLAKSMSTVYPGARRFQGFTDFPHWSGPASWGFQFVSGAVVNQSEYAIGVLVFIPIAVLVLLLGSKSDLGKESIKLPLVFSCVPLVLFILWIITPWTKTASDWLLLSRLPPERIMQILGVLSPLVFVMSVIYWREQNNDRRTTRNSSFIIGSLAFLLTLQGTVSLRLKLLSNISVGLIWATALVTAIAIALTLSHKLWKLGLFILLLGSLFSVFNVNPIVRGIGIFGDSKAMNLLEYASSIDKGRWASDNFIFDSVPTGAGLSLLSGNQGSGPNLEAYRVLDPTRNFSNIWNRGGSYVFFNWTSGPGVGFVNPNFDVIAIQIDPCNVLLNEFELTWVVSSTDLSSHSCLEFFGSLEFQGTKFNVYNRR